MNSPYATNLIGAWREAEARRQAAKPTTLRHAIQAAEISHLEWVLREYP